MIRPKQGAYSPQNGRERFSIAASTYAFELPDGRIAFSIGDVAGHWLGAVVIMGEVRQGFRAAALNPESPSVVLERANAIVNMRPDATIVTAIFGMLDPRSATFTYACAGHPPPLLAVDEFQAATLPSGGIAVGITDAVNARDWTFTLTPESLLVLYTDGIVEYDREIDLGERRLAEAACLVAGRRGRQPATAIVVED